MSFALVDPFDLDLEGHKTIGFFLVPWVTFGCDIVRITKKLWPVESWQTDTQTHTQTDRHCETYISTSQLCWTWR